MTPPRTALVTGGAKRLGRAIVEDLANCGFNVAIHAHRSMEEAELLAGALRKSGCNAIALAADLADAEAVSKLVGRVAAALGPLDLLVNSASVFKDDGAGDFDGETFDLHFAVHVKAPAILAGRFADQVEGAGLVVNMIDQRVWALRPDFFTYTLSKSALWTATRTMAQAFAPKVRVNAIGPGPTLRNARQSEEDFQKQIEGLILKRGPDPREIGPTIRYLYETPSLTGQMIALDGGQHLAWETPDVTGIKE